MTDQFDIAVIGNGVAGLSAVQHALMAGCTVAHVVGWEPIGGLVCNVGALQGYPAGAEPVSGLDLALAVLSANVDGGVTEVPAEATSVERQHDGFLVSHSDGSLFARHVIAATGARLRPPPLADMHRFEGRGISQCAWCDGALFAGQRTVVVGGGDAALDAAIHLASFAEHVTVVVRGERLRARHSYIDGARNLATVEVKLNSQISAVSGDETLASVTIEDRANGTAEDHACNGLFVFVGLEPRADAFAGLVELDANGAIVVNSSMETATPGCFAVGAVRSGYGGRLVQAMGEAATAAIAAAARC